MNIFGIGTDIVSIARIRRIWDRYGQTFAGRILSPHELADLSSVSNPVAFLAKRYAAKEALAKALGTGFGPQGVMLKEIGIHNDDLGRPHLHFTGRTAMELSKRAINESHVTLSDERDYAIGFVILIRNM